MPVILPGYDDRNGVKTQRLIRKVIRQAGLSAKRANHAELEWRNVGYLPSVDWGQPLSAPPPSPGGTGLPRQNHVACLSGQPLELWGLLRGYPPTRRGT
ncbi:MAG: hypothetical protein K6T59_14105 [Bryobacteraceae bacterium]|nr:hypothetical protein [Bryobacteraceae bacterium]